VYIKKGAYYAEAVRRSQANNIKLSSHYYDRKTMANPVTISMPRIKHAPIMVPANALQGGGPLNGDEIFVTTGLSAQQGKL